MKDLNLFIQFSRKKSVVFLLVFLFLAVGLLSTYGQEISLDNYSGEWTDNTSWTDSTSPGNFVDGFDIEVYGYITHNDSLTYDDGTLTIHDTLVIHGNLSLLNNAILTINVGGILLVDGDYYSENKAEVTTGGILVVTGEFSMVGADDQGSFTNNGSIFIFDDTPEIKSGDDFIDLQCDDPSDYPANCAYGDEIDISVDPVGELFSDVTCTKYDTIAPVLVLPALAPVTSPSDIPAVYSNYNAMIADGGSATDDCNINKASLTHISDVSDGNSCPEIITRTYTISDKAGNTTTAAQTISIIENTAPTLTLPSLPSFHCINNIPLPYTTYSELEAAGGEATDNTDVDFNTLILVSEDTIIAGDWTLITRTYEIADLCGNTVNSTQDLFIRDNIQPFLTGPSDVIMCAENPAGATVNSIEPVSYSDNCSAVDELEITYNITGATLVSGQGDASGVFFNNGVSTVTYTVTDKAKNTISSSFTVTIDPLPTTSAISGISFPVCEASNEVYSVSANSTSKFLWKVPSDATIFTDTSGLGVNLIDVKFGYNSDYLTVTEIDENGCTGETKSLEIGLVDCPLIPDFDMDNTTACLYDSVTFWSTSSGVSPTTVYTWDFGPDAQPSIATGPGPHKVLYESAGSKSIQLTVEQIATLSVTRTIEVDTLPSLVLTVEDRCGDGPVLFTALVSKGNAVEFSMDSGLSISGTDYTAPFEHTTDLLTNQPKTVWGRGIDMNTGCKGDWYNTTATILPLTLTGEIIPEDTSAISYLDIACFGETNVYRVEANTGSVYRWQIPALGIDTTGPDQIEPTWNLPEGIYNIMLQEIPDSGCIGTIEEGDVFVSYPVVDLGPDQEICEGDNYIFTPDREFVQYLWHDGSTLSDYTATSSETVMVHATDEYGCTGLGAAELLVHTPVLNLGENKQVCDPEGEELYAGDYANYQWSTGDITSSIIVFSNDGPVSLTVTDWDGCTTNDEITILDCDINSVLEIPGIISPNGDGIDDTWFIPDIDLYPDAHIQVFDMFGRKVFQVNGDYTNTWDGTYSGRQLPVGRYFYIIDFKSSELQPLSGSVTIVR